MKKLVIFDLDGTTLNTVEDLAQSTNYALQTLDYPTHAIEAYKIFAGNGINKMFERTLPETARNEANILKMRELFIAHYDKHNTDYSKPYKGIPELLTKLQDKEILLA